MSTTANIDDNETFAHALCLRLNRLLENADVDTALAIQDVFDLRICVEDRVASHPDISVSAGNLLGVLGVLNAAVQQGVSPQNARHRLAMQVRDDGFSFTVLPVTILSLDGIEISK